MGAAASSIARLDGTSPRRDRESNLPESVQLLEDLVNSVTVEQREAVLRQLTGGASSSALHSESGAVGYRFPPAVPQEFKRGRLIATGSYGRVYAGTYRGQPAALKVLLLDEESASDILNEVRLCLKLNHRNLVQLLDCAVVSTAPAPGSPLRHGWHGWQEQECAVELEPGTQDNSSRIGGRAFTTNPGSHGAQESGVPQGRELMMPRAGRGGRSSGLTSPSGHVCFEVWVAMELCDGGTLAEQIARGFQYLSQHSRQINMELLLTVALDIARALAYMHSEHVCHGDLKCENVLLKSSNPGDGPDSSCWRDAEFGWLSQLCSMHGGGSWSTGSSSSSSRSGSTMMHSRRHSSDSCWSCCTHSPCTSGSGDGWRSLAAHPVPVAGECVQPNTGAGTCCEEGGSDDARGRSSNSSSSSSSNGFLVGLGSLCCINPGSVDTAAGAVSHTASAAAAAAAVAATAGVWLGPKGAAGNLIGSNSPAAQHCSTQLVPFFMPHASGSSAPGDMRASSSAQHPVQDCTADGRDEPDKTSCWPPRQLSVTSGNGSSGSSDSSDAATPVNITMSDASDSVCQQQCVLQQLSDAATSEPAMHQLQQQQQLSGAAGAMHDSSNEQLQHEEEHVAPLSLYSEAREHQRSRRLSRSWPVCPQAAAGLQADTDSCLAADSASICAASTATESLPAASRISAELVASLPPMISSPSRLQLAALPRSTRVCSSSQPCVENNGGGPLGCGDDAAASCSIPIGAQQLPVISCLLKEEGEQEGGGSHPAATFAAAAAAAHAAVASPAAAAAAVASPAAAAAAVASPAAAARAPAAHHIAALLPDMDLGVLRTAAGHDVYAAPRGLPACSQRRRHSYCCGVTAAEAAAAIAAATDAARASTQGSARLATAQPLWLGLGLQQQQRQQQQQQLQPSGRASPLPRSSLNRRMSWDCSDLGQLPVPLRSGRINASSTTAPTSPPPPQQLLASLAPEVAGMAAALPGSCTSSGVSGLGRAPAALRRSAGKPGATWSSRGRAQAAPGSQRRHSWCAFGSSSCGSGCLLNSAEDSAVYTGQGPQCTAPLIATVDEGESTRQSDQFVGDDQRRPLLLHDNNSRDVEQQGGARRKRRHSWAYNASNADVSGLRAGSTLRRLSSCFQPSEMGATCGGDFAGEGVRRQSNLHLQLRSCCGGGDYTEATRYDNADDDVGGAMCEPLLPLCEPLLPPALWSPRRQGSTELGSHSADASCERHSADASCERGGGTEDCLGRWQEHAAPPEGQLLHAARPPRHRRSSWSAGHHSTAAVQQRLATRAMSAAMPEGEGVVLSAYTLQHGGSTGARLHQTRDQDQEGGSMQRAPGDGGAARHLPANTGAMHTAAAAAAAVQPVVTSLDPLTNSSGEPVGATSARAAAAGDAEHLNTSSVDNATPPGSRSSSSSSGRAGAGRSVPMMCGKHGSNSNSKASSAVAASGSSTDKAECADVAMPMAASSKRRWSTGVAAQDFLSRRRSTAQGLPLPAVTATTAATTASATTAAVTTAAAAAAAAAGQHATAGGSASCMEGGLHVPSEPAAAAAAAQENRGQRITFAPAASTASSEHQAAVAINVLGITPTSAILTQRRMSYDTATGMYRLVTMPAAMAATTTTTTSACKGAKGVLHEFPCSTAAHGQSQDQFTGLAAHSAGDGGGGGGGNSSSSNDNLDAAALSQHQRRLHVQRVTEALARRGLALELPSTAFSEPLCTPSLSHCSQLGGGGDTADAFPVAEAEAAAAAAGAGSVTVPPAQQQQQQYQQVPSAFGAPWTQYTAKICDFGFSQYLRAGQSHASMAGAGTITHQAPEVLRHGHLSPAADIYSFGIILWELLTGERPFRHLLEVDVVVGVSDRGLRPQFPPGAPAMYVALAQQCWAQDPAVRPSAGQLIKRLNELLFEERRARHAAQQRRAGAAGGGGGGGAGGGSSSGDGNDNGRRRRHSMPVSGAPRLRRMSRRLSLFLPFSRPPAVPEDTPLQQQQQQQQHTQAQWLHSAAPLPPVLHGSSCADNRVPSASSTHMHGSGAHTRTTSQQHYSSMAAAGASTADATQGKKDRDSKEWIESLV